MIQPSTLGLLLVALATSLVQADPPATAPAQPKKDQIPYTLTELFKRVPPLKHDASGRMQLIAILPFRLDEKDDSYEKFKPFPDEVYKELGKRGLTQWVPPREQYIPMALAMQKAGLRVEMMEGQAFNGPPDDVKDSQHHLPKDFVRDPDQPAQQPHYPCPLLLEGWKLNADKLRATMQKYKDAGVTVDAVWLDWEIEPFGGESQWREAKACSRCQEMFPPGILDDHQKYRQFIVKLRDNLFSTYFAAPIAEVFPKASTTNWEVVYSSAQLPTLQCWGAGTLPPSDLGLFTAANPVAYGNTIYFDYHWKKVADWPLDTEHMDRVYTHVMFGQVSQHRQNAMKMGPWKQSVPWVDRYCPDDENPSIPVLTRPRYREILRHIWLRGTDSMQIFNPAHPEWTAVETEEIEDVVSIYDEMLEYRKFLENGTVLNVDVPEIKYEGAIWSGMRLGDEAVIRAFTEGKKTVKTEIWPFEGLKVDDVFDEENEWED
jgi:carboxyl-terminal processing protease